MNNKIQKLANIWANVRSVEQDKVFYKFSEEALFVFAENIIKECIQVVKEQRDPHILNYKPSILIANAIASHFKVKE